MKNILISVLLTFVSADAKEYTAIIWSDLKGHVEAYDDPFKKLTSEQLSNLEPTWEGFIELKNKMYMAQIDVRHWEKGKYNVEGVLMGVIFQHPLQTDFFIK